MGDQAKEEKKPSWIDKFLKDPDLCKVAKKAFFIVVGIWVIYFIAAFIPEFGTHGDTFGSLNALFSGLAFLGLIVAVMLQSRELELQRDELKASVEAQNELVNQTRADSRAERVRGNPPSKTLCALATRRGDHGRKHTLR